MTKDQKSPKKDQRLEREAAALRANLQRRKAQQRQRQAEPQCGDSGETKSSPSDGRDD